MRRNAHEMLAEGEFNRFYIRALCARAIEDGLPEVTVYRAKRSRMRVRSRSKRSGSACQRRRCCGIFARIRESTLLSDYRPGPTLGCRSRHREQQWRRKGDRSIYECIWTCPL